MVVDEQGFLDEEASDETLYVTIDGRTVPMATANILTLEGVDVPQGVRAARVMEIERRYEDRYNAETMPAAAAAPATSAVPAAPEGTNVSEVSPAVAEDAARVLGVSAGELSSVIPTEERGLSVAQRYEDAGDVDSASTIRGYVAERFGAAQPVVTIGGNDAASPEGVAPEAEQSAGESTQGVAPESMPQAVLSPAQQRKAKRAEIAKRIPGKGNKKLWTQAKAEDVAEYIATLTDDAALQQAAADKYIAAIREKQEKMDAIEALELEDDVAFWNDVKARLAQPVAVETQTKEGATAQTPEATLTPMAMDDVAVQEAEESTPSIDSSTSNVDSSTSNVDSSTSNVDSSTSNVDSPTSGPESQIESENGNENQFEDNSELGARLTNEVSNEQTNGLSNNVDDNVENNLKNGINELNLQQENVSNNGNEDNTPVGGQVPESVPQGEHGEVSSLLGGAQETAARLRERIATDGRASQTGVPRNVREVENRVTREYAKENGLWIPFEDVFKLGYPSKSGNEHDTYLNAEQRVIYKVNNRMNTPSILDLLDRMEQHNKLFPNSKYSLVGFTAVSENGDVWPVFAQDYVPDARMASIEEIDGYMSALSFTRVGDGRYSNGGMLVKDLKPRNVLVNENGDVFVVDAEFEAAAQENGENRSQISENAQNEGEKDVIEEIKTELGILNRDNAAEYARRLFAVNPWNTLEEADAVLKGLLASYGEALNGQTLGVIPFLDEARNLISDKKVAEMREQNRVAEERQQRAGVPPRMSDYSTAINAEDTEAQKAWEDRFNDYLDKLTIDDLSAIDSTISGMQERKSGIKAGNSAGYMENPHYKAFDNIEKMLKKRKRELEKSSTNEGKRKDVEDDSINEEKRKDVEEKSTTGGAQAEQTENANLQTERQTEPAISQESEQVSETDAEKDDIVLSESEYADARSAEIMADNPNLDDVEAYNMALDEYPKYIGDMINSGKLSKIYKKANIGERIALNKSIQAAGYEISDVNVQEVNKKAESKFKVGDEVTATFGDGSVVSGAIEKIEDGRIKIRSNGRLYPVDESKIGKGVELQRGSLSLDGENPAFKAATEKTMQALEKTGVEVVMATEEQVQAVMEIADDERQMIADANERFNRELDAFKEKQHKGLLHLGRPMGVLSAAGVNVRELTLSPKVLNRKMKQHGLTTDDLKGLAKSIQSPILVYKHGEKAPNIVVVTELDINNGKLSIALELDDNGNVVEVNNISSVHSKDAATELERLAKMKDNGLKKSLRWVEKEKVLNWFGIADLNSPIHTDNSELVSVANVINDFENPKVSAEFSRVYHGSGAKFDRFDHSFMGMGEGAQAFGWGTYVTEVEGIGRTYATSAARGKNIDYEKTSHAIAEALEKKIGIPTGSLYIMYDGRSLQLEVVNGNNIREKLSEYTGIPIDEKDAIRHALAEDAADLIEEYEHIGQRYRYTVEIPDDNGSNYLHWEKPVSDNAKRMLYAQIRKEGAEKFSFADQKFWAGKSVAFESGELLYDRLTYALGSDKAASEFLSRAGFAGISYPALATAGGRADGARNYVIFNENDAQITDRVEFLRTSEGTVYGWAVGGRIYLTPEGVNPNTPVHEYTHLWASAIEQRNPELWAEVVEAVKLSPAWAEVAADEAYRNIWNDDSRMASEVLARLSGGENYRRTMQEAAERENDAARKFSLIAAWGRVKRALAKFWNKVREMLDLPVNGEPGNAVPAWERFVNSAIGDFYRGVNPNVGNSPMERMFIGEKGARNLDNAQEATTRLDNLAIAREMETAGKDAKSIKMATGWERGADGKWRYETEDVKLKETLTIEGKEYKRDEVEMLWRSGKLIGHVDNKALFDAYPELADVRIETDDITGDNVSNGAYNPRTKTITIHADELKYLNSILNHEIQHAIQHIEGFAKGSSPNDGRLYDFMTSEMAIKRLISMRARIESEFFNSDVGKKVERELDEWLDNNPDFTEEDSIEHDNYLKNKYPEYKYFLEELNQLPSISKEIRKPKTKEETYRRLAGEVESRNVQTRMGMSEEERRASLAKETEDVAREDQIFIYDNLGVSANEEYIPSDEYEVLRQAVMRNNSLYAKNKPIETAFTANNFYIYNNYGDDNFSVVEVIPIEGNEDLIDNIIHSIEDGTNRNSRNIDSTIARFKRQQEQYNSDNANVEREREQDAATGDLDLRQPSERGGDNAQSNSDEKGELDADIRYRATDVDAEAERTDAEITAAVERLSAELNTPVEIVTNLSTLPDGRKRASKGWYEGGRVYLVLPNAESVQDAVETVLHEVVGHRGLRALFGERFDAMLDDVFTGSSKAVRSAIMERALPLIGRGRSNAIRVATEEYMAEQAERGFDDYSLWDKVRGWFSNMLRSMGLDVEIGDNEIRYMLWRSYRRMKRGETFAEELNNKIMEARFRNGDGTIAKYESRVNTRGLSAYNAREAFQDEMLALKEFQRIVEEKYGEKIPSYLNVYEYENRMSSVGFRDFMTFSEQLYEPLQETIDEMFRKGATQEDVTAYLIAKSGLERNRDFSVRDYLAKMQESKETPEGVTDAVAPMTKAEAEAKMNEYMAEKARLLAELNAGSIGFRYCLHTFCMKIKAMRYSHFPIVEWWWQVKH
ncbi:MAG: hypothetical protein IJN24_05605 [Bacteroidaceae bacterium]|nr:hypothetical protein [Bacteroidaceae bacterium]